MEKEYSVIYDYYKCAGHHYRGVPTFWEVVRGQAGKPSVSNGWFFREELAKEFCKVMNEK